MNVYFRLRVEREGAEFTQLSSEDQAAFAQGQGVSDHPDRGYDGQPLHYAGIHALSPPVVVPVPVTAPACYRSTLALDQPYYLGCTHVYEYTCM